MKPKPYIDPTQSVPADAFFMKAPRVFIIDSAIPVKSEYLMLS